MTEKYLGKIESVRFGFVPDRNFFFGLQLSLKMSGYGTCWSNLINIGKECKWNSVEERNRAMAEMINRIINVMKDAGVTDINKLKDKPVEVEMVDGLCKGFRILTEVL